MNRILKVAIFGILTLAVIYSSGRISLFVYILLLSSILMIESKKGLILVLISVLIFTGSHFFTNIGAYKLQELTKTDVFIKKAYNSNDAQVVDYKAGKRERISSSIQRGYTFKILVREYLPSWASIYGMGAGQSFSLFKIKLHNYWLEIFFEFGWVGTLIFGAFFLCLFKSILSKADRVYELISLGAFSLSVISLSTAFYFIPMYILFAYYLNRSKAVT